MREACVQNSSDHTHRQSRTMMMVNILAFMNRFVTVFAVVYVVLIQSWLDWCYLLSLLSKGSQSGATCVLFVYSAGGG